MTRRRLAARLAPAPALLVALVPALVPLAGARAFAREEGPEDEWGRFTKVFRGLVGRVSARKLTYRKFPPLTDVRGRVRVEKGHWWFENVAADFCGGRASGDADIRFGKGKRMFRMELNIAGARLEDVTRFFNTAVMEGSLSGKLGLSVASDKSTLHGGAEFSLRDADLGELPLALNAVSFVFLKFPELQAQKISQADGDLTIAPRGLVFQNLSLSTDDGSFSLVAERLGTINYKGKVDMYFEPVFAPGIGDAIPIVAQFQDFIRSRGGRVRVTGTVKEPSFKWAAFR